MKKIFVMTSIIITAIVLSLITYNQFIDRSIKTEILIDAPAERVWQVLLEHESYYNWNPFIKSIKGSTEEGDNLEVTIQGEGNEAMVFKPEVLTNSVNKEFRWRGKFIMRGIVDGEHFFILENIGDNQTRFVHGEHFTGLLSGIFMNAMKESTETGFLAMNEALKLESEK